MNLFYIKSGGDKEYYLTSGNNKIIHDGDEYLPYSGLSIRSGEFNDSAENHIILHGIFEEKAISRDDNLMCAIIKIMHIDADKIEDFVTYICTEHKINDLDFELRLEPETIKYNKSLLQMFSKHCRANFGDDKCKINKYDYAIKCNIIKIEGNRLNCNIQHAKNDYFTGGILVAKDSREFCVLAHHHNNIEIDSSFDHDLHIQEIVTLIPTCDKNFKTCSDSFNNAINFRGEPHIPESNIVKN